MYFNLRTAFINVSLRYNHGGYDHHRKNVKFLTNFCLAKLVKTDHI